MTADNNAAELRTSTVVKLPNGRFAPGNPGRIPGSKNKISNEAMSAIKDMKDAAIEQLRSKLERGDWDAITFILERILPKGRSVELEDTSPTSIAKALAEGHLTPDETRSIATALKSLQDVTELAEIRAKLDELEKLLSDGVAR
ncbi:hypothetical protein [Mesorhizobium sp. B2-5-7]|uniref:hypothetical protein n=1 Tax=Mesorhizobium sp. B2-5-7 TaxID=2589923 RepID=UPI00112CBAA6|nr:hypothetical protein [Mesorhizobium sp. B2-5-7]TPK17742.1 hypothetical protein FJ543_04335 [Mesorhizobium sp. B2-5-7]